MAHGNLRFFFTLGAWGLALIALLLPQLRMTCPALERRILNETDGAETADELRWSPSFVRYRQYHASACTVLLSTGAIFGLAGMWVCDDGRNRRVGVKASTQPGVNWRFLLSQMPSTVSENIHDTTSPHGTAFKALMLLMSMLLLISEFPSYDLHSIDSVDSYSDVVFSTLRSTCPAVGVLILIFIPTNPALQNLMDDRLATPGYVVDVYDKNLFIDSEIQTSLHALGGVVSFVISTFLELASLTSALTCHYIEESSADDLACDMVHWGQHTTQSHVWLALSLTRVFVLFSILPCLIRFAYETSLEPTLRCRWRNPDFSYMPERMVVTQLATSVLILATSICFVSTRVWTTTTPYVQTVLIIIAGFEIVWACLVTMWTIIFVTFIDCFLSDESMRLHINKLVEQHNKHITDGAGAMKKLEMLQNRMKLRQQVVATPTDRGDSSEEDVSAESDWVHARPSQAKQLSGFISIRSAM